MRTRRLLPVVCSVWLVAGCLELAVTPCGDLICPSTLMCAPSGDECVVAEAVRACAGKGNQDPCTISGELDATCDDGVCRVVACGNARIEAGEVCDDGNRVSGDGCSALCNSDESCGNGVIDALAGEQCDDGNLVAGDGCGVTCQAEYCGDGDLNAPFEQCDEGAANSDEPDATCRKSCRTQACGDGIVDPAHGEQCDDGNLYPGDGCTGGCVVEACGNGIVDLELVAGSFVPAEACDDGENGLSHDGCAPLCTREDPVWSAAAMPPPSPRFGHAMVYDAARGKAVAFGGSDAAFRNNDTWEYDGAMARWVQVAPIGMRPSPRLQHAMAYDAASRRVVLFGGDDGTSTGSGETWEYDGARATWTLVTPVGSTPSPRNGHAMAYDAARRKIVLFGGTSNMLRGDTWEYDSATRTWAQITPSTTSPSPRRYHAMTYDAARGAIVLFGGSDGSNDAETWEYAGATAAWTQITPAGTAPSPRAHHAMAYDAAGGKVVLFGGGDGSAAAETWEYDGAAATWAKVTPSSGAPSGRTHHALAYDLARQRLVLFGGYDGTPESDTWEYDRATTRWTHVTPPGQAPSPRVRHAMVYDALRGKVVLFGGVDDDANAEIWEYDGPTARWTLVTPLGGRPSPRYGHAMAYDAGRGKIVLFGGWEFSGADDETWEYDTATATWTQILPTGAVAPARRDGHAMAYDTRRGKVVLFGGQLATNRPSSETWEYDGATATWTEITLVGDEPAPRAGHAMAYDPGRGKVVLFGGADLSANGETWEYDGAIATWTRVTPVGGSPLPRSGHAMAYDAARGTMVMFGGWDGALNGDLWEYDGATPRWGQVMPSGIVPTKRADHAMAYDAAQGEIVLFGGDDGLVDGSTFSFQYRTGGMHEACQLGFDADLDGLVGCDDPDCWAFCTPTCPPRVTCPAQAPGCGDGTCNPHLESPRLCSVDCGPASGTCGDHHCDFDEDVTSCPGDCTP